MRNFDFVLSAIGSHQTPIRLSVYFSAESFQARREWDDVFKILKEKKILSTKNTICGKVVPEK